jgi:hypothetical protein
MGNSKGKEKSMNEKMKKARELAEKIKNTENEAVHRLVYDFWVEELVKVVLEITKKEEGK